MYYKSAMVGQLLRLRFAQSPKRLAGTSSTAPRRQGSNASRNVIAMVNIGLPPATRPCARDFMNRTAERPPGLSVCKSRLFHTTPQLLNPAPPPHALRMVLEPLDASMIEQELRHWPMHSDVMLQVLHFYRIYGRDHILMFRVGSKYEIYGSQAQQWFSEVTHVPSSIPGAGFAIEEEVFYEELCKLVYVHGQRVAMFGQLVGNENAIQRATAKTLGSKNAIRGTTRYLQRIYTPGTFVAFEDTVGHQLGAQHMDSVSLAALYIPALHTTTSTDAPLSLDTPIFISITDRLTFNTDHVSATLEDLSRILQGLCPSEIIVPPHYLSTPTSAPTLRREGHEPLSALIPYASQCITQRPANDFVSRVHPSDRNATIGGIQSDEFLATRHAIVEYVDFVHVGSRTPDIAPSHLLNGKHAIVPRSTATHLELFRTAARRSEAGSVIGFMDESYLRAGRRVLRRAMMLPFLNLADIEARAARVELLRNDEQARTIVTKWMEQLMRWPDLESIVSQITSDATTLPALYALRHALATFDRIRPMLATIPAFRCIKIPDVSPTLALVNNAFDFSALEDQDSEESFFEQEIEVIPPIVLRKDAHPNYIAHLDMGKKISQKAKQIQDQFVQEIDFEGARTGRKPFFRNAAIVSRGQDKTDVMSIVTRAVIDMAHKDWQRVPESKKKEMTVVESTHNKVTVLYEPWNRIQDLLYKQRRLTRAMEKSLIRQTLDDLARVHAPTMHSLAAFIADADLLQSLVMVADKYGCSRAIVPSTTAPRELQIRKGFHPILYKVKSAPDSPPRVVASDIELNEHRSLCILSGANMSGKSTALRTVGVTAIMSQLGSFVPAAASTSVPIYDAVFTRFGAVDDLSRNLSTFHIEILELGEILRKATRHSLVLIDELGRGTSRDDGTALACAMIRELLKRRTTTLITTHYLDLDRILKKHLTPSEFERVVFLQTESRLVDDDPAEVARNKMKDGDDVYVPPVHVKQEYRLVPGMAKASRGLEIAKTSDLSRRVLSDAFKFRDFILARNGSAQSGVSPTKGEQ